MTNGVRVRLLGSFEIEGVGLAEVRSRKARTLVRVLALAGGRPVSVDRLIEILWGDTAPRQPEREVAVNASRIRSVVGADALERIDAGYRLRLAWSDVQELADLAAEAQRRLQGGDPAAARSAAGAALALARGPLLADEVDPWWAEAERATTERQLAEVRTIAAEAALVAGDAGESAMLAEAALDHDPYDEPALRTLMRAHVAAGRPGSALAAYATVREHLAAELGASPAPETEALHTAIVCEEPLPDLASSLAAGTVAASGLAFDAPAAGGAGPAGTALVGRARELAALDAGLGRAGQAAELVVVTGEPGAGKSLLVETWAEHTRAAGVAVLVGRCDELGRSLPLQPIADALAAYVHGLGRMAAAELLGDERGAVAPLIGPIDDAGGVPSPAGRPEALQALAFAALVTVFERIGGGRPAVLVIDDAHLAGESTLAWLRFVARRRTHTRLMVVAAARPHECADLPATDTVALEPFGLETVQLLVGAERAPLLLERSGGNPLLLAELAEATADGDELPDSLRGAVITRLADVGDAAATLRTAAMLGPEIDLDLLAGVLGRTPLEVLDDLERGVVRSLLIERGSRFVFRHDLVRTALAGDTTAGRRALVHRAAAHLLADRPGTDPLDLAYHARLSGDRPLASRALVEAARLSAARYDLASAEMLLDEAIELDDTVEARLGRARVRIARGDLDGADTDGLAARAKGGEAKALEIRAWVARHRNDVDAAIRLGDEGAHLASDPATRTSCLIVVAFAYRGLGDLVTADRVLEDARHAGADMELGVPGWIGVLRVHQGRPREALALLDPAVGAEVDSLHGLWVEHVLQMAAHANALAGRPAVALGLLDRLVEETQRRGSDVRYAGLDQNYRAWILRSLGDPGADEHSDRALEVAVLTEVKAQAWLDRADAHLREGSLDDAADALQRARELTQSAWFRNRWRCEQRALWIHSGMHLASGDYDAAESEARALVEVAAARGDERYLRLGRIGAALAGARRGERLDPALIADDVEGLDAVAGLEGWWLTADLADAFDVDEWRRLAAQRADELARGAGARAESFRSFAARRLDARR